MEFSNLRNQSKLISNFITRAIEHYLKTKRQINGEKTASWIKQNNKSCIIDKIDCKIDRLRWVDDKIASNGGRR